MLSVNSGSNNVLFEVFKILRIGFWTLVFSFVVSTTVLVHLKVGQLDQWKGGFYYCKMQVGFLQLVIKNASCKSLYE
jgi:hypothetical protein